MENYRIVDTLTGVTQKGQIWYSVFVYNSDTHAIFQIYCNEGIYNQMRVLNFGEDIGNYLTMKVFVDEHKRNKLQLAFKYIN